MSRHASRHRQRTRLCASGAAVLVFALAMPCLAAAQNSPSAPSVEQQVKTLTDSITRMQTQMEESQRQLDEMRRELNALREQLAAEKGPPPAAVPPSPVVLAASNAVVEPVATPASGTLEEIRERQSMQESQLATLDQAKVESESKYPVVLSGMVLFNAFSNTIRVDMPATPTVALFGGGSNGSTVRQTVLGLDARGPHLWGATSHADLRFDFDGSPQPPDTGSNAYSYDGYNANATMLRLRTAHASLDWPNAQVFFSLDRPIFSPDSPTSLAQVAEPPLAWSGSLWAWNVQAGASRDFPVSARAKMQIAAAMIDVADAPWTQAYAYNATQSSAEVSRWPGGELHVSVLDSKRADGAHLGVGAFIAPHKSSAGYQFNSWASTLDARMPLPWRFEFSGSAYRGLALGGLGEGEYKDYVQVAKAGGGYLFRALDDVGGWAQLKHRTSERLQLNAAFGVDQVFARQLRPFAAAGYQDLARNRTWMGNVIYSPSAYLLFSFEYRRLESAPVTGRLWVSDIFTMSAGYKF